jgi:Kdo2-lipid IVA lauroyltransferase/acyltransferase
MSAPQAPRRKWSDYLLTFCLHAIARLPRWFRHRLSDLLFGVIYYLFKYRKVVVIDNLTQAFPNWAAQQLNETSARYFGHLSNTIVETLSLYYASPEQLNQQFSVDLSLIRAAKARNQSVILLLGHQFNWEMANLVMSRNIDMPVYIAYTPISNPAMNRFMLDLRSLGGANLFHANELMGIIRKIRDQPAVVVLVGDQNPTALDKSYWIPFFGRKVPVHRGMELLARATNSTVLLAQIAQVKRGIYEAKLSILTDDPAKLQPGELTDRYMQWLEDAIRLQPENYVWSHRRWKHSHRHMEFEPQPQTSASTSSGE